MRFSSRKRPAARESHSLLSSLAVLAIAARSLSHAFSFTAVPSPNLDFSKLGRLGIAGDFDGISLYQYETQTVSRPVTNGSESLLTEMPNGVLARFAGSDATIRAMCRLKLHDGSHTILLGGNFTSIDGMRSTALALFNANTTRFTSIDGMSGQVNALLCDQDNGKAYVGGNFKVGNSTNAITWLVDAGWAHLPFSGFNAPVNDITQTSNGHIVFGGAFTGLGNVSAPNEPDAQVINLSTAHVTAANSALTKGFDDPQSIICSDGSDGLGKTWLVEDGAPGIWEASFDFGFEPTKLRLWNTHLHGRGTKSFYFLALPINGIMNFTYVDPATGKNASCTNQCPLSNDPNVKFQDFHFVNTIGMNHFQIITTDFYGAGAGFAGIQLFEDNIFSYAVQEFNEPACGIRFPSTTKTTGPWTVSQSVLSDSSYLAADLSAPITSKSASIVFTPNIRQPGNYSINMYTPGCIPDNTCPTRGRVNITGTMSTHTANANFSTSIYQTNYFDKYDQIYFGFIDATTDSFKPSVTITPLDGQGLEEMTFVAQKVGFTLINGTGGLNGVFDFDPAKAVVDLNNLDESPINKLGRDFNHSSEVTTLATAGNVTYIGGNFATGENRNLIAVDMNKTIGLDGGLNGHVLGMHLQGDQLYVGGEFTNKQSNGKDGLNYVAAYNTKDNSWSALGAGLNGRVEYVVPFPINISNTFETAVAFTGSFSECKAFGNFAASATNGFAVWVPSKQNWLANLKIPVPGYTGRVTSCLLKAAGNNSLCAGSLSAAELGASGAATLTNKGLGQFPVKIQRGQSQESSKKRRDVSSQSPMSGIATGAFYNEGNSNLTILAGHFSTQANGSAIYNLVIIDGKNNDAVSGLGSGISTGSSFTTLAFHGSVLFAGGSVDGTVNGAQVNGIIAYDVARKSFSKAQPAPVSGGDDDAVVSAIAIRPGTSEVYAGGSFARAGALECPGVCLYDAASTQWTRPGNSLGGRVKTLMWLSKTELIAGGDLVANGSDTTYLAKYDVKKRTWQDFLGADQIPGPIDALTPASYDNSKLWVSGKGRDGNLFMMRYDGKQWQNVEQLPPRGSVIQSLQMFSLTKSHDKADLVAENQVLMLTGSIPMPKIGSVSAVLFNGTDYQPYALATGDHDGSGTIARIFSQNNNFFKDDEKHLPLVFVVLIGLAISLALVLFLVVSGIVLDRVRKRREGYTPAPTSMYDRGSGIQRIPPRELLEELGKSRPGVPPHV